MISPKEEFPVGVLTPSVLLAGVLAAAVVIDVTAHDVYVSAFAWNFAFGYRAGHRLAVLSTARMGPTWFAEPANPDLLRKRLRKAATRMVGFLYYYYYYGYRETADRRSVMLGPALGIDDLDRFREDC